MDTRTHDTLGTLKLGAEKQNAYWLTHPDNYGDLIDAIVEARESTPDSDIGNALTNPATRFPESFKSSDSELYPYSYPNYLASVIASFSDVTSYTANSARERAIVYAPPLPIEPDGGSMSYCFYACRWLLSIYPYDGTAEGRTQADDDADVARLNSATDCSYMFYGCVSLVSVPSVWTFQNLDNANNMFASCTMLNTLPSGFLGTSITRASSMFNGCTKLETLPSGFTLQNVAVGGRTFRNCWKLASLPSSFRYGAANSLAQFFLNCASMTAFPELFEFDVTNLSNALSSGAYNTSNTSSTMYQIFWGMGAADGSIGNSFVIGSGAVGIKFDLYLHENGFEKLSAVSVVSLFDCLHAWSYDEELDEFDYSDRFPNAEVAAATDTPQPTIYVTSAIFAQLTAAQKAIAGDKGWKVQAHL